MTNNLNTLTLIERTENILAASSGTRAAVYKFIIERLRESLSNCDITTMPQKDRLYLCIELRIQDIYEGCSRHINCTIYRCFNFLHENGFLIVDNRWEYRRKNEHFFISAPEFEIPLPPGTSLLE